MFMNNKKFGHFRFFDNNGRLANEPIADGDPVVVNYWHRNTRNVSLLRNIAYIDPNGYVWKAWRGNIVNGLSTPRWCWFIIPPYVAKAREASVFHDVWCEVGKNGINCPPSWKVHQMFYFAMRANGVHPIPAFVRWFFVRVFGPRF
ncbi:MAG: DUF1353 domain-containing protein [Candidatus Lokiarchaeota archaeon]|nr:DUF1353 domain-containing protein [Candidatus Lokiarchaeota archaeon]